jgi:hypothetical protein
MGVTLTLLTMLGVAPAELHDPGADAAMAAFVEAVRTRARKKLPAFLCTSGRLRVLNTLEKPYRRSTMRCDRLVDLDDLLFGDDGFRDYVMMDGRKAWRPQGDQSYAPPYRIGDPIYVRWRREGERWVIDEIAMPSS